MDGLECSEVMRSTLERTTRIDSEFYQKESFKVLDLINGFPHKPLTEFVAVSDGNHMTISDKFSDEGIPYYRGQDIKSFFIENSSPVCIDENSFSSPYMKRSHLKKGDVLLSIVGTIGSLALVYSDKKATCSCKLAILRPKADTKAEVIATFLSGRYGQNQIKKYTRGAVQMGLILEDMEQLIVPAFRDPFKKCIQDLVVMAFEKDNQSKQTYFHAEQLLLSKLGMANFTPSTEAVSIKPLSVSFLSSGRLDAEYYQPKYEDYTRALNTSDTVKSLCHIHDKNYVPRSDKEYMYIELANVGLSGNISDVETLKCEQLPSRARRKVKPGQVLVASVEGSLQCCALITDEFNGALCSTGFYVLDSAYLNPETLLILFKSEPIQALMKQRCSGTILTAISKDEIEDMPLPQIDSEVQKQIARKVQESFTFRHKSEQLLDDAKHAVEIAIEQGEDEAMNWLNDVLLSARS